ncbi:MAG: hypothetical protein NC180_07250 [Muribaculaceae bacterium]|nr:hypothetical protein [Roseburia sp.]MCM1429973.1 hypothetical protein [Muribaculaceae bacterium]MCM1493000.1 hypothetical protein [Muribaculaceae bacterium]
MGEIMYLTKTKKKEKTKIVQKKRAYDGNHPIIQFVRYQFRKGRWIAVDDKENNPAEAPRDMSWEEYTVYDTETGIYTTPKEAEQQAQEIILAARKHQTQREKLQAKGIFMLPRNSSENTSAVPLVKGHQLEIETSFGTSFMGPSMFRESGGTDLQPMVRTAGAPASYEDTATLLDQMSPKHVSEVADVMLLDMQSTDFVPPPEDLLRKMTKAQRAAASQMEVMLANAETHKTRALRDGGKTSRAAVRMAKQTGFQFVTDPDTAPHVITRHRGNAQVRRLLASEVQHTPKKTAFAPLFPFLSPRSPSPEPPRPTEEQLLWLPVAVAIEKYMREKACERDRRLFEEEIGFEAIRKWIEHPEEMTDKDITKLFHFH